jgi:periplasmic protein CpxP/Spy
MRKSLFNLALTGALMITGSAAFAQSDTAPNTQPATGEHHRLTADEQTARMAKELDLSADQVTQIKPILADRQQQMEALHQDQSTSSQDKMTKMKSLRDDSNAKIEAVLNDTQKQKFEQMQAKQQQHWQSH